MLRKSLKNLEKGGIYQKLERVNLGRNSLKVNGKLRLTNEIFKPHSQCQREIVHQLKVTLAIHNIKVDFEMLLQCLSSNFEMNFENK